MIDKVQLVHACQSVIRQLLILTDKGYFWDSEVFHRGCEEGRLIATIKAKFKDVKLSFLYVDEETGTYKPDIGDYFESAMKRHANTVAMKDFGLRSNALLMAVNVVMFVIDEAYEMTI